MFLGAPALALGFGNFCHFRDVIDIASATIINTHMPTLRHYDDWGTARFITFSCHGRLPLLVNPEFKQVVSHEVSEALTKYPIALLGYVVMPEHVHSVLFPRTLLPLGRVIGEIKSKSAIQLISRFKCANSPLLEKLRVSRMNRADYAFWL
ncbi:MAG: transposase, partial [Candidatus Zixiibacteriota bacterium]